MSSSIVRILLASVFIFSSFGAFAEPTASAASLKPLALVWHGPGACIPGCAPGAVKVALSAGYRVRKIYPGFKDYALFKEAKIWVQPGGKSVTAAQSMGTELIDQVRQFVYDGGGYVGFCAGMFITTAQIGTSGKAGYGIAPGATELHLKNDPGGVLLSTKTKYGAVTMYYAGGPEIAVSEADLKQANGAVIARYKDGKIAGLNVEYGKGRVSVIGTHPEADWLWKLFKAGRDRDGSDRWFAREMFKYASGEKPAEALAIP